MNKQQRWETVKIHELCFCCLEEGHKVVECSWGSICNIDGCLKKHNRMLHNANQEGEFDQNLAHQSKISLIEGEENRIHHLWQQNVKSWGVFHSLWKMGVKV